MKEIALHILDIAENSIAAGADRISVSVVDKAAADLLSIRIEDNGKGMSGEEKDRSLDPFYTSRSTRKVGMGIPLFRQHAEMTGGALGIESEPGAGTSVKASFRKSHPDRQPLGDLEGIWMLLITANQDIEWSLKCASEKGNFSISTSEIRSTLAIENINGTRLSNSLKRLIRNNLDELGLT